MVHYHLFPSIVLGRMAAWAADVPVRISMIPGPYYLEAPVLGGIDVKRLGAGGEQRGGGAGEQHGCEAFLRTIH